MNTCRSIALVAFAGAALLASGAAGAQYRYTGATGIILDAMSIGMPSDIPSTTSFPATASGFVGQIVDVRVSMYIVHPADQELRIILVSPGNAIQIPLVQNREDASGNVNNSVGATGADFGTGCADAARTMFDDAAMNQIPPSTAPYVGLFIPVFPYKLAAFDGLSANGSWQLQVTDYRNGNSGTLACWTLSIDSTDLIFRNGFD